MSKKRNKKRNVARKNRNRNQRRLLAEQLEDRRVLTTFTVDTISDEAFGGGDLAAETADGDGLSLREAIELANTTTVADTVEFDASVFTGGANSLIRLTQGSQLEITEAVTIDGSTGSDIVITGDSGDDDTLMSGSYITDVDSSAGSLSDNTRIFYVSDSDADTTLNGLTLTGGYTAESTGLGGGGALRSLADLTISDVSVTGNSTLGSNSSGGGVFSSGAVSLTDSEVNGNRTGSASSRGGGISGRGGVYLTNSTVSNNLTSGTNSRGGGIYGRNAPIELTNSTVSG
ncbi:MAG: hypothetical protein AAF497_11945, partial [Planctomycetota bacterium]